MTSNHRLPHASTTFYLVGLLLAGNSLASTVAADEKDSLQGTRQRVQIRSSVDESWQPCYVITPPALAEDSSSKERRPLLVSLHTWSGDVEQRNESLEKAAIDRGWIYLFPHFRGPNRHPDACGSVIAQQDILDAVAWARETYSIDDARIYLTGLSGGGHMTMQMAGRYPEIWAAASAWVGISDMAAWHEKHAKTNYGAMMRQSCGGAPGDSQAVDRQYRERSPLTWLAAAKDLPLDIAAGVHDGHDGSVPVWHSLAAFNVLARARQTEPISDEEMAQIGSVEGRLVSPRPEDQVTDETFGRAIYLRRQSGPVRVTIFEGGHEGITSATVAWLEKHRKPANTSARSSAK